MGGYFEPLPGGGALARFDEAEAAVLSSCAEQLIELLGPDEEPAGGGPEALIASVFAAGPEHAPGDPALARLFPDAYGVPDREPDEPTRAASAEFRRFTEPDLRARKRADLRTVARCLAQPVSAGPDGVELRLTAEECRGWLGAVNDLRLALGTRLRITDEQDADGLWRLPDADPMKPVAMVYLWLSQLQELLVDVLMGPGQA